MVQKEHRQPRRTAQEWIELIQECRTSGILRISDSDPLPIHTPALNNSLEFAGDTVIRLTVHGIRIEITNAAAGETIANTITALQRLC
jgi:hypothetical protein